MRASRFTWDENQSCSPLDMNKPFKVPEKLIQFEARVKLRETAFLNKRKQDMDDVSMEEMNV